MGSKEILVLFFMNQMLHIMCVYPGPRSQCVWAQARRPCTAFAVKQVRRLYAVPQDAQIYKLAVVAGKPNPRGSYKPIERTPILFPGATPMSCP